MQQYDPITALADGFISGLNPAIVYILIMAGSVFLAIWSYKQLMMLFYDVSGTSVLNGRVQEFNNFSSKFSISSIAGAVSDAWSGSSLDSTLKTDVTTAEDAFSANFDFVTDFNTDDSDSDDWGEDSPESTLKADVVKPTTWENHYVYESDIDYSSMPDYDSMPVYDDYDR
jgi:hypothetical protein